MRNTLTTLALATAALSAQAAVAPAGQVIDWSPGASTSIGALGSITATLSQPLGLLSSGNIATSFSAPWFSGPVSLTEALAVDVPTFGTTTFTLSFSQPVQDLRLSLASFASRANLSNDLGTAWVRESGQTSFQVACGGGCIEGVASNGTVPNDSNGTLLLPGLSSSVTVGFTSLISSSDGVALQFSAIPVAAPVPEPTAWALLLAGALPLLGVARHRQQRR